MQANVYLSSLLRYWLQQHLQRLTKASYTYMRLHIDINYYTTFVYAYMHLHTDNNIHKYTHVHKYKMCIQMCWLLYLHINICAHVEVNVSVRVMCIMLIYICECVLMAQIWAFRCRHIYVCRRDFAIQSMAYSLADKYITCG